MNNTDNINNDGLVTKIIAFSKNIANGGLFPKYAYIKLFRPFVNNSNDYIFYIDGWTITHLFGGLFFGYLYLHLKWKPDQFVITAFLISFIWEVFEGACGVVGIKMRGADSLIDSITNILFFMLGATIAYKNIRTIK